MHEQQATTNYRPRLQLCREAIRNDLKERKAAVLVEAAMVGKSIRNASWDFANCKAKMIGLRRLDGIVTASPKAMEKIIHNFYSVLFGSHVYLQMY